MAGITFHSTRQASRGSATGKAQGSWTDAFPHGEPALPRTARGSSEKYPPFCRWVGPVGMSGNAIQKWSFCVGWRAGFPAAVSGSGVAAELRPCEGSGQDDGHPVILAAHPCGMTLPERPGWHLPSTVWPPFAAAGRWPSPDPASCYPAGRLAVTARSGARPGAREMILFFDGPADAAQMPPEGV
jgi:hypothetical protein